MRPIRLHVALLSIVLLATVVVHAIAQSPPAPPVDIEPPHAAPTLPSAPPAISADCQAPGLSLSGDVPLPNLAAALRSRNVLKIMSIGASYGAGSTGRDYFDLIEHALEAQVPSLDVKIIDRGVSGELARDAGERMKVEVALTSPDLVIWQVGTNDALAQIPAADLAATVRSTIQWLKAHNVDVALVGLHYIRSLQKDPAYQEVRRALGEVARDEKVLRIGRYEAGQIIDQLKAFGRAPIDEFVMTDRGNGCLAEYVVRALSSGLFARKPGSVDRPRM